MLTPGPYFPYQRVLKGQRYQTMKINYSGRTWPIPSAWVNGDEDNVFPPEEMLSGTIMDREIYLDELTDMVNSGLSVRD